MKSFLSTRFVAGRCLLFVLVVGLLHQANAAATSPQKKNDSARWEVERSVEMTLIGSFSGKAYLSVMKRKKERMLRFQISDADSGMYDIELIGPDKTARLGTIDYPKESTKFMDESHAEFENIFGGYWQEYHVIKRDEAQKPVDDGLSPPPGDLPPTNSAPDEDF